MQQQERPYWNPYVAGVALGLVALGSFILTGRGLGASGAVKLAVAAALHAAAPTFAEENGNIGSAIHPGASILNEWIVFLFVGTLIGGVAAVLTRRRFRVEVIRGPRSPVESRLALALLGGIIAGVGAQMARGCTSGQAITGGSHLALGSWIFMFSVFGGAYAFAYVVRRQWL